ncbi:MAG: filamentous hemagglutinin N-terminal domain-containing protein [Cyanobacteria bacterium P01_F01_bin.33]
MKKYIACSILLCSQMAIQTPSVAQVSPDQTGSTRVTSQQDEKVIVSGGQQAGKNLFHSFEEFSVPEGSVVSFDNSSNIQNIINRVTGNSISEINGTIHSENKASVFLINPNGIVFGPKSRLDVNGSFIATTANGITFADESTIYVDRDLESSVLSVHIPIGLQFGTNSGSIHSYSRIDPDVSVENFDKLTSKNENFVFGVPSGNTIALIGQGVFIEGSLDTAGEIPPELPELAAMLARGGRIEIGSVAAGEQVKMEEVDQGWRINYDSTNSFEDIKLSKTLLEVAAFKELRSTIRLYGKSIVITDSSNLGSLARIGRLDRSSEDRRNLKDLRSIFLQATDMTEISNHSEMNSYTTGSASSGIISISTKDLSLFDSRIDARKFRGGEGGAVRLDVESDFVSDFGRILASGGKRSNAGSIFIEANNMHLRGGSRIVSPNTDIGTSGHIDINVKEHMILEGERTTIRADIEKEGRSKGGNLEINAEDIVFRDNVLVSVENRGSGGGGSLKINAESLSLENNSEISGGSANNGAGGNLDIDVRGQLVLKQDSLISVESFDEGGDLNVSAGSILLDNKSRLSASTESGNGGDIFVSSAGELELRHGSSISTSVDGNGNGDGGNIMIDAQFIKAVPVEDSDIFADAGEGSGGNITITANGVFGITPREARTELSDITASSQARLNGAITINSPDVETNRDLLEEPDVASPPKVVSNCSAGRIRTASSFVDIGRGGLPPGPDQSFGSSSVWEDLRAPIISAAPATIAELDSESPSLPIRPAIVEAQGWIVNEVGDIVLIADAPNPIATVDGFSQATCRSLALESSV